MAPCLPLHYMIQYTVYILWWVDLSHLSDTHIATFLPSLLNKMREKMMEKLLGWNNDREITDELPLLVNDLTYGKY